MFHQYTPRKRCWDVTRQWKVTPIRHGIRISIAHSFRQKWVFYIFLPFGVFWTIMGMGLIAFALMNNELEPAIPWLIGWGGGEWAIIQLVRRYFTQESITMKHNRMFLRRSFLGMTRGKAYDISLISHIRLLQSPHLSEKVGFNYDRTTTIHLGKALTSNDAQALMRSLSDILLFSCYDTENIIFGEKPAQEGSLPRTLYNPDVSELTFPFVHLKRIIIDTETYNFYLVERFLTYALTVFDQKYLKQHVIAEIMGASEKLHPNLRNNLICLCKQIDDVPGDRSPHILENRLPKFMCRSTPRYARPQGIKDD